MGNWLESIFNRLADLWPWRKIQGWQKAVRTTFLPIFTWPQIVITRAWPWMTITFAPKVEVFSGPAVIRVVPWFDSVEVRDVKEDSYNLPTQSVTTKDGKAISFGGAFFYEIEDVQKAVFDVRQFESTLQDLAMVHMAERLREMTWQEALRGRRNLSDHSKAP